MSAPSTSEAHYLKAEKVEKQRLKEIGDKIYATTNLDEILIDLKNDITEVFDAERLTLYVVDGIKRELVSRFMSGQDISEIRVPISNKSIVGFACLKKSVINIPDVYDEKALTAIDPNLHFDKSWDTKTAFRTKQVLAVPVVFKKFLLGAVQLINNKHGKPFSTQDEGLVNDLAKIMGNALHMHKTMAAKGKTNKFGYLLENHFITQNDLKTAAATAREKKISLEEVLIDDHNIAKAEIGNALSRYYGVDFVEFNKNVPIPGELLVNVKPEFIRRNMWVPIRKDGQTVIIAIDNPENLDKTDQIKLLYPGKTIKYNVAIRPDIESFINHFTHDEKKSRSIEDILKGEQAEAEELEEAESMVDEESGVVVQLANKIIIDAYERNASDIHIEPFPGNRETKVRIRIDGTCSVYQTIPASYRNALVARLKIMSDLDIAERRKPQDGKIKFKKYGGKDIELRVATVPTQGAIEDVVMRILAAGKPIPLDKMGFAKANFENFVDVITKPYGIIFVCGPTGSGKTTTLHSALGYINTDERKIWTAEDPVEITQDGLRQVQVQSKIGFTFATAMRAFLRADPDVIMVGEMRDIETTSIGIEASLTGHLVFSTLHTNSAPESITRLLDMGMDPFNFSDAILAILAQRLVRTLCKNCKEEYHPTQAEYDELLREYGKEAFEKNVNIPYSDDLSLCKPKGCDKCNNSGYAGRMGLHELLTGTDEMKKLIQEKAKMEHLRDQAIRDGMTTLKQDGIAKIFGGNCDLLQVRKVCIK